MLETVEATIDHFGHVTLNEKIRLNRKCKALVTILDEEPVRSDSEWSLRGSATLVREDLESASRELSDEINTALERSGEELRKSME